MLTHNLPLRGFSRLLAVMFAVQIVVGGFCLLTVEAHAMPASVQTMNMDTHCAKSMHTISNHEHESDHSGNCYHCDQLFSSAFTPMVPVSLALSGVISLPAAPQFGSTTTGRLSARIPTGPPRSSSLLYTITQRIRV